MVNYPDSIAFPPIVRSCFYLLPQNYPCLCKLMHSSALAALHCMHFMFYSSDHLISRQLPEGGLYKSVDKEEMALSDELRRSRCNMVYPIKSAIVASWEMSGTYRRSNTAGLTVNIDQCNMSVLCNGFSIMRKISLLLLKPSGANA